MLSLAAVVVAVVTAGDALPRFVDVAAGADAGLIDAEAHRVTFADVDGDGYPDLILGVSQLWRSQPAQDGGRRFVFDPESGLDRGLADVPRAPDLVLLADLDGDGDLDAVSGRSQELERPLVDAALDAVILDRDGCPVPKFSDDGQRSEVLLNDGSGRFEVRRFSGISRAETTSALAVFDWDRDGILDLFVGNWYREYAVSYRSYSDRLYRGLGGGRFEDVTARAGMLTEDTVAQARSARPTFGVTHADIDGDGLEDVLVATYGRQWNVLWRQRADGTFEDVAAKWGFDGDGDRSGEYWKVERESEEPFRANGNTFDLAVSDFDNDGDLDVFTGEICHWWGGPSSDRSELLINLGDRFERRRDRGIDRPHLDPWKWNEGDIHVGFLDFDNDGLDDLLIASGDYPDPQYLRLFQQLADHTFAEVTATVGLLWEGSGGISIADYDRDGDLDILIGRSLFRLPKEKRERYGKRPGLWRNDGGNKNRWLQVRLRGTDANRDGIGARVVLTAGDLSITRELIAGRGHMGHADELVLHFGLGRRQRVDSIDVRWPDRSLTRERFGPFDADQRVVVVEGRGRRLAPLQASPLVLE